MPKAKQPPAAVFDRASSRGPPSMSAPLFTTPVGVVICVDNLRVGEPHMSAVEWPCGSSVCNGRPLMTERVFNARTWSSGAARTGFGQQSPVARKGLSGMAYSGSEPVNVWAANALCTRR